MNLVQSLSTYFRGALEEVRKVSWPTKKQVTAYSAIVIGLSIGMAIFFGALDYVLNLGLTGILK
jgi:preprotein translocase subunit SecE